jgi:hypothetical protein
MLSFKQYNNTIQEATHYRLGKSAFEVIRQQFQNNSHINTLLNALQPYASKLHLKIIDNKITNNIHFSIVDDFQSIKRMYDAISHIGIEHISEDKNAIKFHTGGVSFTFYKSGGGFKRVVDEDGNETVNNRPSSYQHEEAITYILNSFPEYPTKSQINKTIGFEFDDTWFLSFKETYNAVSRVIDIHSYEFYRDSDKNKLPILTTMTQSKYLPDSKDNWNPSDVWAINKHHKQNVIDTLSEVLYRIETGRADVYDLNDTIKHLFDTRQLIGFSLKKVIAPTTGLVSESTLNEFAKVEKVEVDYNYVDNLWYDRPLKIFKFNDMLSYINMYCIMEEFGKDYEYMFRLAPRGKSNDLNVYCQGSADFNKSNWDGSSSKALINKLTDFIIPEFKDYVDYQLVPESNVLKTLDSIDSKYSGFVDYVKNDKFVFIDIQTLETEEPDNQYTIKRCLVLLHFLYCLEQTNMRETLKMLCLSSKKQNHFSSVFYKIS